MRGSPAFDDVLDEALTPPPHAQGAPTATCRGTAVTHGFFFLEPGPVSTRPALISGLLPAAVAGVRDGEPVATCSRAATMRPARRLTRRHRQALETLTALGARIRPDFSSRELRTAYRALARRYHPDRHATRSERDKATLAMLFRHASDAYRVLSLVGHEDHEVQ